MEDDEKRFRSACSLLAAIVSHGRREAGVILLGLLSYYRHDLGRLSVVVRALGAFRSRQAVDALTEELHRVRASNATRRYLDEVLSAVMLLPRELAEERLTELSNDRTFSVKWRRKFENAARGLCGAVAAWEDE